MMRKYKFAFFFLVIFSVVLTAALYLSNTEIAVLNPKGVVAAKERNLIALATFLMLIIVIPVFIISLFFSWRYRSDNTKAKYSPDFDHYSVAEVIWWSVPLLIVIVLSIFAWKGSYELDPYKPIRSQKKSIKIQVVALDWKWLFIYPELKIASINFFQIPEKTPIDFDVTADAPMNSFWIPQLGGQIYAMPGMRSKLHSIADVEGTFRGSSANLSGRGFAGMTFTIKSSSQNDFDQWVNTLQRSSRFLDYIEYEKLVEPSEYLLPSFYSLKDENIFNSILLKYSSPEKLVNLKKNIARWFGRFSFKAFKHDWIENITGIIIFFVGLIIFGILFYFKRWKWLWSHWLTSLDPKKIGVMYFVVVFLMLFKGLIDAVMMRTQQALSVGDSFGYLSASHFQQIFTSHGTTMIFFVGMGIIFGLMNLVIPLQIGARDVAFPFLNSISFWLFSAGAALLVISLNIGEFSAAGWVAYPPLSDFEYNPGVGVDYWIWSVQIAGVGSLLSGINFFVTIFKMRCSGMTFMKLPLFTWSVLATLTLILFAFPILTATAAMLALDRYLGMHFFTAHLGGNPMMYVNLIWAWGHPEVYILNLPAFGVFSEVVATFSKKRIFGYRSMVWALIGITFLSFIVWLHHFFTMGAQSDVNAFFGIMTMLIAIPTGVKVFNWLFTQFRGRIHFSSPMLWLTGFVFIFTIGGMTGVLMSIPPIDFQVHNSLFLIAHFHSMLIGSVLFGFFAGLTYWFPKVMGFKLNERLGKCAFWFWFSGFLLAFFPLYILGLMGATRRLNHYDLATGWRPLFIVAAIGVFLILCGLSSQILQFLVSIKNRKKNIDTTGDPWDGRTLEWSIPSPPPLYNFAVLPDVKERDAFWAHKKNADELSSQKIEYEDIEIPKNTPAGILIGGLVFVLGFSLVWHLFWLSFLSLIGVIVCLTIHLSKDETEYTLSASEVEKIENKILYPS